MTEKVRAEDVVQWIKEHWRGAKVCPICGSNDWRVNADVVALLRVEEEGTVLGGATYPLVLMTCGVCGYTLMFNALIAGLVKP
jgi:predicted nucleic-acid-binding Zn-ribbon protein